MIMHMYHLMLSFDQENLDLWLLLPAVVVVVVLVV
jgi:hypothetical protein